MFTIVAITEALLIVTALSMDAFVSGFAYGANQIKIPFRSMMVINLICSGILAIALFFGGFISQWLPDQFTTAVCCVLLLGLGITKVFDSAIKTFIRRHEAFQKKFRFSISQFRIILNIYADPEKADRDQSRILSPAEAAYLAVALSIDGLAVGFSAGITSTYPLLVIGLSLITDLLGIVLGSKLGQKVTKKLSLDLTWLSGALLILLAIMKLP